MKALKIIDIDIDPDFESMGVAVCRRVSRRVFVALPSNEKMEVSAS